MFLLSLLALFTSAGVQNVHDNMKMQNYRKTHPKKEQVNPYRERLEEMKKDPKYAPYIK